MFFRNAENQINIMFYIVFLKTKLNARKPATRLSVKSTDGRQGLED